MRSATAAGCLAACWFVARAVRADAPFVDRPLTLPVLHVAADAGLSVGQNPQVTFDALGNPSVSGYRWGAGGSLEAAVGLPLVGEIGARIGYRFDDEAIAGQVDRYARLFDPIVNEPGEDTWTNPEFYLRGTLVDIEVLQVGLETRLIFPTAQGSNVAFTPGIPVRVHIPGFVRIDTGAYFPVAPFDQDASFAIQIPAQLFFQAGAAFFGPLTGLRYEGSTDAPNPAITAGVGGGYTVLGFLDIKAQIYTDLVNDPSWANHIGGGVGVGLRVP